MMIDFNYSQGVSWKAPGNTRNRELIGGRARAFTGPNFMEQVSWVARRGLEASALVVSVVDTGTSMNMNPVMELSLKVTPSAGAEFGVVSRVMVSRFAVPRKGDLISIKYNPADLKQIFVMPQG